MARKSNHAGSGPGQSRRAPKAPRKSRAALQPRFRILVGGEIALGPGKAELLAAIERTGSISEAAREMEMSYMRAWNLVRTMNTCFREPLVQTERGGRRQGGAGLTATGRAVLKLYHQIQERSTRLTRPQWHRLETLLAP